MFGKSPRRHASRHPLSPRSTSRRKPTRRLLPHRVSRRKVNRPTHRRSQVRELQSAKVQRFPVSALHLLNHHSGKFQCKIPGCRCEEGLSSTPIERCPVIRRSPVTQNHLIAALTGRFKCEIPGCPCHEAAKHYEDAFHESIYKLVEFFISIFCSHATAEERKDLSQQCLIRLTRKLSYFDPDRGVKFSTWAGTVISNILRYEYKIALRRYKIFGNIDYSHETIADKKTEPFLRADIIAATGQLRSSYPKWRDVFDAVFGRPGYPLPPKFSVTEVARVTGRRYNEVHVFLTKTVRPFFKNWFQHGGVK
jgi:hypothetical protein